MTMWRVAILVALCSSLAPAQWKPLFDGKSLAGWKESEFRNKGEVKVEEGRIVLGRGDPLTGITRVEPFPKIGYEMRWEAVRLDGADFFASLTFPYGDSYATWVVGGWGGDIVGLSSIDGWDASENETRMYYTFEPERWYAFRLRVVEGRITAWIDDQKVFDVEVGGRKISLRPGPISLSVPLGFAAYRAKGGIRKIEYRPLN